VAGLDHWASDWQGVRSTIPGIIRMFRAMPDDHTLIGTTTVAGLGLEVVLEYC